MQKDFNASRAFYSEIILEIVLDLYLSVYVFPVVEHQGNHNYKMKNFLY